MRWIGQHIWDFISRFRSDVYLEDLTESAQDHVVGVAADGKLYKQDVAVGDITGVSITTDSGGGSKAEDTSGSADFSILGATGVGVTNSGTTITATAVPGEIDHDSLSNFVAAEHYRWDTDIASTATIHTENITDLHGAGVDGTDNGVLTDAGNGKITSESFATLSSSVSTTRLTLFSPANTSDLLTIDTATNGATTLTTTDADAQLANFEIAADGDITLDAAGDVVLECGGSNLTCDAGTIAFSSSGANRPDLGLTNNADDATGPSISLKNNRDGNGLEDNDVLGSVKFVGEDVSGNYEQYGSIIASVVEADHGDEAGQIAISVANDGTERNGITMTADKGTAQEVDVTIANGTSSTTTIAGHLTVTTEATIPSRKYELPSSTVGDYKGGDVYYYGDGSTVKGKIYGIDGTNWSLADADSEAATKGLLAVALGTDPDVDGMLLRGFVTLLTEIEGTEAIGSPLYLSATDSGIATVTVPASGDFVRVLGYSLHASDNQVYFNPDNTWVERA